MQKEIWGEITGFTELVPSITSNLGLNQYFTTKSMEMDMDPSDL